MIVMTSNLRRTIRQSHQDNALANSHQIRQVGPSGHFDNAAIDAILPPIPVRDDTNDATFDAPRLLPISEVMRRTSLGRTTVYQLIKDGTFPPPVKINAASRWIQHEVTEWIRTLMSKRYERNHR